MDPKKSIQKCIRGWLPQEPNLTSHKRAIIQRNIGWLKWYAALIAINAAVGGLLSVLAWSIGLTQEPWISIWTFVWSFILVMVSIIFLNRLRQKKEQKSFGM
jgi:hypothetical protein